MKKIIFYILQFALILTLGTPVYANPNTVTGKEAVNILLDYHNVTEQTENIDVAKAIGIKFVEKYLTREEAVTAIIKSCGIHPVNENNYVWNDEQNQSIYNRQYIDYARRIGVTSGTGNNNFSPKDNITLNEFLIMLSRLKEINPQPFYTVEYESKLCKFMSSSVQEGMSAIPENIIENFYNKGWAIIASHHPIVAYGTVNKEKIIGMTFYEKKSIYIAICTSSGKSTYTYNTTIHEFGHFVSGEYKNLISRYKVREELDWLISKLGNYCNTNNSEFFAESFEAYICFPVQFSINMPQTYFHINKCIEMLN